jgi:hypothetical protein
MKVLREQLLGEIPLMRATLARARKQQQAAAKTVNGPPARAAGGVPRPVLNSNNPALSKEEASMRFQSALEYRRRNIEAAARAPVPAVPSSNEARRKEEPVPGGVDAAAQPEVRQKCALDTSSMAANLVLMGGHTNERAKAALLKALEYKQGRRKGAGAAEVPARRNAIRMTPVEGRSIGGVVYDGDASKAAAGKSSFIKVGRPVSSYRSFLADEPDLLAPNSRSRDADGTASPAAVSAAVGDKSQAECSSCESNSPVVKALECGSGGLQAARGIIGEPQQNVSSKRDYSPSDRSSGHRSVDVAASNSDAPVTISGTLADRIGTSTLAALVAVAASVHSQEGAMSVLLDLRAKQAAATAATTHAAAMAAVTDLAGSFQSQKCKSKGTTRSLIPAGEGDDKLWDAAKTARAAARTTMKEFDIARQRAKVLLERVGNKPWIERAVASLQPLI